MPFSRCLLLAMALFAWPMAGWADGGYFSRESVAVSADQQALIIRNGYETSMTLSTGYTGEGEDFAWIIPVPSPPAIANVTEASREVIAAFGVLDQHTAPQVYQGGGCFPAGTEVLAAGGPRSIEGVEAGARVYAFNFGTGTWELSRVRQRLRHRYRGDMITIQLGATTSEATGNHPLYVVHGKGLAERPIPRDVPAGEAPWSDDGRWVEARDLEVGDVLKTRHEGTAAITALSRRSVAQEVYNLTVDGNHNYAVHASGILAHNKGAAEGEAAEDRSIGVKVFGTVTLEHYRISILGAGRAVDLLSWLHENGYRVDPQDREVLHHYIERKWTFVAVKLNPGKRRHYENEPLPPLTVRYQSDQLVFPLYVSSVSTTETVTITLYVFAESTVTSTNYPIRQLRYKQHLVESEEPAEFVERRLRKTVGPRGRRLAVMWSGEFRSQHLTTGEINTVTAELMETPFVPEQEVFLTRLAARMKPEAMTDDIVFALEPEPQQFAIHLYPRAGRLGASGAAEVTPVLIRWPGRGEAAFALTYALTTRFYPWHGVPAFGLDVQGSVASRRRPGHFMVSVDPTIDVGLIAAGPSVGFEVTPADTVPYTGFTLRWLNVPPLDVFYARDRPLRIGAGIDFLPLTVRWNLRTGERMTTIGLLSLSVGYSNLF